MDEGLNLADKLAALNRAIIGAVPYAGPALSEIICALIPNQRLDRAIKYLNTIGRRVEELSDTINSSKSKINLIEIGLKAATNSIFEEKCKWIGNVVLKGINENITVPTAENVIKIVEELNHEQVIILFFHVKYHSESIVLKGEFIDRFPELLHVGNYYVNEREKYEILSNNKRFNIAKLIGLGLITNAFEIPRMPEWNTSSTYDKNDLELLKRELKNFNDNLIKYYNSDEYMPTNLGKLVIETMMVNKTELD